VIGARLAVVSDLVWLSIQIAQPTTDAIIGSSLLFSRKRQLNLAQAGNIHIGRAELHPVSDEPSLKAPRSSLGVKLKADDFPTERERLVQARLRGRQAYRAGRQIERIAMPMQDGNVFKRRKA
jgi:hypothetical protein